MNVLTGAILVSGILLGMWGLFHQLIVGAAVTLNTDVDERSARLFLMSWVSHGAYLSLAGFLPVVLLIFHGPLDSAVLSTLIVLAIALSLLSIHVALTGLKYRIAPVSIGFALQSIHALLLFILYFSYR